MKKLRHREAMQLVRGRAEILNLDHLALLFYNSMIFTHFNVPFRGSLVALVVKNSPTNAGDIQDVGSILGSGRTPEGGHGNPLQCSCLENPHGQRSLVGYNPWGRKELDTTE